MTPLLLLLVLGAVTMAVCAGQCAVQRRRRRQLQALAAGWGMQYCADDRFRLAGRVAAHFPVCGVADLRVVDLIYGAVEEQYRYILTAEYTAGVVRTKRRFRRVALCLESREREAGGQSLSVQLVPGRMPLVRQYQRARQSVQAGTAAGDQG